MQQLTGITAIVTEASSIVKGIIPDLADYTPLIINLVQLLVTCCTVYVLTRVGRRSLILFGNWGLALIDVIMGMLFLFSG
jgi:small neutral amino acid transporter SnatA (MarC family)